MPRVPDRVRPSALAAGLACALLASAALAPPGEAAAPAKPAVPQAPPAAVIEPAPATPPPQPAAQGRKPSASPGGTPAAGTPSGAAPAAAAPAGGQPAAGGAQGNGGLFGLTADKDGVPVSVEADQGIEWEQNKQLYIARGNAKAARGDVTVYGQVLTAYYRKTPSGGSDIWRFEASDGVKITNPSFVAVGDKAIYDVDHAIAVLTGKKLEFDTQKEVITARDSLEVWQQRQYAVARGDAKATQADKTVQAKVLVAHYKPDEKGDNKLTRVEAFEDVAITTPNAVAHSLYGDYNLESDIAILKGQVKITRGQDQLEGECAQMDLNTGVGRMFPCAKQDRVRGLLVPKQGEQVDLPLPGQAPPGGKSTGKTQNK